MFLKKVLLQLSDVSMRKYQEHLFSMRPQIQTNMEVILTGGQPSLSGELSGDGGSTMMLATLQEQSWWTSCKKVKRKNIYCIHLSVSTCMSVLFFLLTVGFLSFPLDKQCMFVVVCALWRRIPFRSQAGSLTGSGTAAAWRHKLLQNCEAALRMLWCSACQRRQHVACSSNSRLREQDRRGVKKKSKFNEFNLENDFVFHYDSLFTSK